MINFFSETEFELQNTQKITTWIKEVIIFHGGNIETLNYIFCDDNYLLEINIKYLNHDYYTDIITFDNSVGKTLDGDIFISIDRVKENAKNYNISFEEELLRVIIHGVLHLLKFKDSTEEEKNLMREQENKALNLFKLI